MGLCVPAPNRIALGFAGCTMVYVLHNVKKHRKNLARALDEYASVRVFGGWKERVRDATDAVARSVAQARTWLINEGWKKHGKISVHERPAVE